jgi:hypothetical protein
MARVLACSYRTWALGKIGTRGGRKGKGDGLLATRRGNSQDAMRGWGPTAGLGRTLARRGAAGTPRCVPVRTRPRPWRAVGWRPPRRPGARAPARTAAQTAARARRVTRHASAGNNSRLLWGPRRSRCRLVRPN